MAKDHGQRTCQEVARLLLFEASEVHVLYIMALVRILVDGYSLLHSWPELAKGQPRFSAAAREELIRRLAMYQDAIHTPITIIFDGRGTGRTGKLPKLNPAEVEVLYSQAGQTADQDRANHSNFARLMVS